MGRSVRLDRRAWLRGLGTVIALPWLETMWPTSVLGLSSTQRIQVAPRRLGVVYVPNGIHMPAWTPQQTGSSFDLPDLLKPMESFRPYLSVLSGLTCDKARANGDGPGDHARAMAAFLTCTQPRKTNGADFRVGISMDQVAAQKVGNETRFASLELGIERGQFAGDCDSGYSCVYSSNLAWRSPTSPMPKEVHPRSVFERLFGSGDPHESAASLAVRLRQRKSILDLAKDDARQLKNRLGANDQRKLDEYLTAIRDVEKRIGPDTVAPSIGDLKIPDKPPQALPEHIRLMCDLFVLAWQSDSTRITTFALANEGSNRSYRFLGVNEGHHEISHHGFNKEKQEKIAKINQFHMEQFRYLVERLQAIREGEGTLLDHSMLLYGGCIGDGNRHNHDELPILLVGKGGGSLQSGKHLRFKRETPLANLHLSLLHRLGVRIDRFGDSTGLLEGLS